MIKKLLGGGDSSAMNPLIIGNTVMDLIGSVRNSSSNRPLNITVQNWLTTEEANRASYGNNQGSNPFLKFT